MFSFLGIYPNWLIMPTILCLRGLDVKAGTKDIRTFFKFSRIPDGGVFITGGSLREAFIAFTTEKDAQLALCHSGKTLKGSKVTLHRSSLEELEKKLKLLLKKKKPSSTVVSVTRPQKPPLSAMQPPKSADAEPSTASPVDPRIERLCSSSPITSDPQPSPAIDSETAFLLGVCTVLGLQSSHQEVNKALVQTVDKICSTTTSLEMKPEQSLCPKSGYVRLFGMPQSASKELICRFFKGLQVQEVIVNVKLGLSSGCLVKFASESEACKALLFSQQLLDSNPIEVRNASEMMWTGALQMCGDEWIVGEGYEPKKSPFKEMNCEPKTAVLQKRRRLDQLNHDPPKKQKPCDDAPPKREYMVVVERLPTIITKTEIKELLGCPNVPHKNVLHLLDGDGNRTDTAFVLFNCLEDYEYAMNLTGCHVGNNVIQVSSTTQLMMKDMMAKAFSWTAEHSRKKTLVNGKSLSVGNGRRVRPSGSDLPI